MALKDDLLHRIDEVLAGDSTDVSHVGELLATATGLFASLYGAQSPQVNTLYSIRKEMWNSSLHDTTKFSFLGQQLCGQLRSLASDIRGGRIKNLRLESAGEIFGDLVSTARRAMRDRQISVAAVLACAALEDALKRLAREQGLDVDDKDMTQVINALKSGGFIKGPQGSLLSGFVRVRNKAFHAQWEDIDAADVQGVIGFTQEFLLQNFGSHI